MENAILLILLALLQYVGFSLVTGAGRLKYNVPAPKTTGNETWERLYRVQLNTLEQLIVFVPAMLTFSYYVSSLWVIAPGIGFIAGRQLYFHSYVKDPKTRSIGMMTGFLSSMTLVVGSLIGVVLAIVA